MSNPDDFALDHVCAKWGCASLCLNPKLRRFNNCFGRGIRFGDVDGSVERNGHILWMEWKRAADLATFEQMYMAQVLQAKAFTRNSDRQTFVFVLGDAMTTEVDAFRAMRGGRWCSDWSKGGTERFKEFLRRWFAMADGVPA